MTPAQMIARARFLGLHLVASDDDLVISPACNCPPEFEEELSRHKAQLLALLQLQASVQARPNGMALLHLAKQILTGEFDGGDEAVREDLRARLGHSMHPVSRQALGRLK